MSIQVFAAVVAGSTPGQWSTDAKGEIRMQEITFAKGNEQQLKDCRDALCRSTLGERYFSSPGSAENAILEGIRQENLYVAVHSVMNKATGALLFLLPLTIPVLPLKYSAIAVCSAATFAAIQEGHFIRTGRE